MLRTIIAAAGLFALGLAVAPAAPAASRTECTALKFCYCVNADLIPEIDKRLELLKAQIAQAKEAGKAIGYISTPISSLGGGYSGVNLKVAAAVKDHLNARYGADRVWLLNPGEDPWFLKGGTGADFMLMWTRTLEGLAGPDSDFDFIYFVGPSDFARYLKLNGTNDLAAIGTFYDDNAAADPKLKAIPRNDFVKYYAFKASVAYSAGAHDEWNIARAINAKRRGENRLGNQIGIFFDGRAVEPSDYEAGVSDGSAGQCKTP